jgi:hypothetical protein
MYLPRKPAHADKTEDLGNGYTLDRVLEGYAYGKTYGGSTPRYYWVLRLDGRQVDSAAKRGVLVAEARKAGYR